MQFDLDEERGHLQHATRELLEKESPLPEARALMEQSPEGFSKSLYASLAELGYAGFALDLYGKGVRGSNAEENAALMQPLLDDRKMLQRRMTLALEKIRKQEMVDAERVAAMGFCFGGLSVLDLARTGSDLSGVASFHGLFNPPGNTDTGAG